MTDAERTRAYRERMKRDHPEEYRAQRDRQNARERAQRAAARAEREAWLDGFLHLVPEEASSPLN